MNKYLEDKHINVLKTKEEINIGDIVANAELSISGIFGALVSGDSILGNITDYEIVNSRKSGNGAYLIVYGDENAIYHLGAFSEDNKPTKIYKIATFTDTLDPNDAVIIYDEYDVSFTSDGKVGFTQFNYVEGDVYDYQEVPPGNGRSYYTYYINGETYVGYSQKPSKLLKIRLKDSGAAYNFSDVLDFVNGDLQFDKTELEIPIYFTATVKQTSYTKSKSGIRKTCDDDGEYLYERQHHFPWDWTNNKCLSPTKAKAEKDTPYESDEYNYYSTSIRVGTIKFSLETGSTVLVAVASYDKPTQVE